MNKNDDSAFIRNFSGIIIGLMIFTGVIIILALSLRGEPTLDANPSQLRFAEERVSPVAGVRAGSDGQAALAAAQAGSQAAPVAGVTTGSNGQAALPVGETGSPADVAAIDGSLVYNSVCMACHAAGVAGAPQPGSDLLAQRFAEKGLDGLIASVINGLNVMPPRGGRPDLSDEQIRASVEFMLQ